MEGALFTLSLEVDEEDENKNNTSSRVPISYSLDRLLLNQEDMQAFHVLVKNVTHARSEEGRKALMYIYKATQDSGFWSRVCPTPFEREVFFSDSARVIHFYHACLGVFNMMARARADDGCPTLSLLFMSVGKNKRPLVTQLLDYFRNSAPQTKAVAFAYAARFGRPHTFNLLAVNTIPIPRTAVVPEVFSDYRLLVRLYHLILVFRQHVEEHYVITSVIGGQRTTCKNMRSVRKRQLFENFEAFVKAGATDMNQFVETKLLRKRYKEFVCVYLYATFINELEHSQLLLTRRTEDIDFASGRIILSNKNG